MEEVNRLLAIHHAGGSARSFIGLRRSCPPGWSVIPYEIPGRGMRRREPPCRSIADAAAEVAALIAERRPTVVLGVSMGAVIGYEAAARLGTELTARLVLVSVAPPARFGTFGCSGLGSGGDDETLLAQVTGLGGLEPGQPESPMRELFLQDLREDLALVAAHRHSGLTPHADIEVWLAANDPFVGPDDAAQWRSASRRTVRTRRFPGEHLFLFRTASPASVWQALSMPVVAQRA